MRDTVLVAIPLSLFTVAVETALAQRGVPFVIANALAGIAAFPLAMLSFAILYWPREDEV